MPAKEADAITHDEAFELTIEDFCARQSAAGAAVEMLGAFHSDEHRAGRLKDTEANYAHRFSNFASRPVN